MHRGRQMDGVWLARASSLITCGGVCCDINAAAGCGRPACLALSHNNIIIIIIINIICPRRLKGRRGLAHLRWV